MIRFGPPPAILCPRFRPANGALRIPKDMTRMASALLACRRFKGVHMLQPKLHYQKVSLVVVRKIVEEQIRQKLAKERDQGTSDKTLEEDFLAAAKNDE
jgi:hypothetical protein